jgi:hypothetical protein
MRSFKTKAELIEAKAQAQHEANLSYGGVFNADGSRYSDIETERQVAASRVAWCGRGYERFYGLPHAGWYIPGFGVAKS